jgi:eukaryotic-like serine/threonine-protein kinase
MAKDPAHRPPTASELLDGLEEAIDEDALATEAPTAVAAPAPRPPRSPTAPHAPRPPAAAPRRRWPALAALAALAGVAGAAIAIAAGTGGGGDATSTSTASSPPRTQSSSAQQPASPQPKAQAKPKPKSTPNATPPASQNASGDPVALNDQGFSLIQQGQPSQAVAPLQRSVDAFRAQGRKGEIDYAFALYNLGNALRLGGRPADAIPYLEERLAISDYKRGVVRKELETARAQAGQGGA